MVFPKPYVAGMLARDILCEFLAAIGTNDFNLLRAEADNTSKTPWYPCILTGADQFVLLGDAAATCIIKVLEYEV